LSAIVRAADERPEIAELIKRFLPELELRPLEVTT
jgi:hypothetical protein